MNREYDERLELQLQEYEFAVPEPHLPAWLTPDARYAPEDVLDAVEAIINRH